METLQENNSSDMNTQVQTYLIEETMSLIYDGEKLERWNSLVSDLGLSGQSTIVKTDKSPIPFMHMKKGVVHIFETLCPVSVKVEDFSITPIPVEILDLIALSKREGYFSSIYIRYDDRQPDPVCIGVKEKWVLHYKGNYNEVNKLVFDSRASAEKYCADNGLDHVAYHTSWNDEQYLIGKWADVKRSIPELKKMAMERHMEVEGAKHRKTIKESQRALDDLEIDAIEYFN